MERDIRLEELNELREQLTLLNRKLEKQRPIDTQLHQRAHFKHQSHRDCVVRINCDCHTHHCSQLRPFAQLFACAQHLHLRLYGNSPHLHHLVALGIE